MKFLLLSLVVWAFTPVAWILGQAAAPTDPSNYSIAALLVQLGLSSVFLYLYWQERKERQKIQDERDSDRHDFENKAIDMQNKQLDLLERVVPLLTRSTEVLREVETGMHDAFDRASSLPDRRALDTGIRRNELLAGELRDVLGGLEDVLTTMRPPDDSGRRGRS